MYRAPPLELERSLLGSELVAEAAVIAVPHPVGLWEPKAFVVPARGQAPSARTAAEIHRFQAGELPREKWVKVVEFIDRLPVTASGKIRRAALRERPQTGGTVHRLVTADEAEGVLHGNPG